MKSDMLFWEAGGRSNSGAIPPKAIVQFESGLMVDERMKWEWIADAG